MCLRNAGQRWAYARQDALSRVVLRCGLAGREFSAGRRAHSGVRLYVDPFHGLVCGTGMLL